MESEARPELPDTKNVSPAPTPRARRDRTAAHGAIGRPRWRFLAEASTALDRSLDYEETLRNVVELIVPRMADYAAIALVGEGGTLKWGYTAHGNPAKQHLAVELRAHQPQLGIAGNPTARALRDGETAVINTVDDAFMRTVASDERHLALLRELAPTSLIYVRLATRNRVLGSLIFATTSDSDRRYTDRDVAIANEIGRRAALAVDHAILFREAERAAAARDQMMAVVSHDLRNPLATIQMAVSFLLDEIVPDDAANRRARDQLHAIHRTSDRMYRLVQDLLNVSAIEAGQLGVTLASVTVDALVSDALELLRPLAVPKEIALVTELSPALPRVTADRERLLQVFSNLGGNAIKFTPAKGRIEISAAVANGMVEFMVRDTGPGIAPEELPHVFDRFWQAKKAARSGVGLGLAIAKGIVESHGGRICAMSELGRGSSFVFTVPVSSENAK
jgi:signal transduction histidine kinase